MNDKGEKRANTFKRSNKMKHRQCKTMRKKYKLTTEIYLEMNMNSKKETKNKNKKLTNKVIIQNNFKEHSMKN